MHLAHGTSPRGVAMTAPIRCVGCAFVVFVALLLLILCLVGNKVQKSYFLALESLPPFAILIPYSPDTWSGSGSAQKQSGFTGVSFIAFVRYKVKPTILFPFASLCLAWVLTRIPSKLRSRGISSGLRSFGLALSGMAASAAIVFGIMAPASFAVAGTTDRDPRDAVVWIHYLIIVIWDRRAAVLAFGVTEGVDGHLA